MESLWVLPSQALALPLQAIGMIDHSFVQALQSVLRDAALVSEGDISEALKALSTKDDGRD